MARENGRQKKGWQWYLGSVLFCLLGAVGGFMAAYYVGKAMSLEKELGRNIFLLGLLLLGMYLAFFLQIIVHEAGHLAFGLLSGYAFSSFRIMDFMWIKEDGKLRLKKFSLAGTGGQCLMEPPEMKKKL